MTEQDMILGTQRGDRRAFEALLVEHRPMMLARVRRWIGKLDLDDLMQAARVALWRAALCYDPNKGASFSTHAGRRLRVEIRRCVVVFTDDVKRVWTERARGIPERAVHYDEPNEEGEAPGADQYASSLPDAEEISGRRGTGAIVRVVVAKLKPELRAVVQTRWLTEDEPLDLDLVAALLNLKSKQHAHARNKNALAALRKNRTLQVLAREAA